MLTRAAPGEIRKDSWTGSRQPRGTSGLRRPRARCASHGLERPGDSLGGAEKPLCSPSPHPGIQQAENLSLQGKAGRTGVLVLNETSAERGPSIQRRQGGRERLHLCSCNGSPSSAGLPAMRAAGAHRAPSLPRPSPPGPQASPEQWRPR